jgi:asparagine synthase (glutamine-hydrolysing)
MQSQSSRPVRTFTIGTHDPRLDESADARAVAGHLGTEHTEFRIGEADLLDAVPQMARIYDEPFADSSQVPTYLVSRLARRHVTVALTGDGGDEMFGGYYRHRYGPAWRRIARTPRAMRLLAAGAVEAVPTGLFNAAFAGLQPLLPERRRGDPVGDRLKKAVRKWAAPDQEDYIDQMYRVCEARRYLSGAGTPGQLTRFDFEDGHRPSFEERAILSDVRHYLPGDLLVKVDRASMACSLEARAPFLDSEVFAFAWSLPMAMKVGPDGGKRVLRGVLERHLPRALWDRPKKGFGVPIDRWLRGELKDWAGDLLGPESLARTGLIDAAQVRRTWDEHQRGAANHAAELWTLLMFQAWAARA